MAGEFDFIEWIRAQQKPSELVNVGVGDDLAVLNWPKDDLLIVGVDQVLDGVHFDSKIHPPRAIGRKVMNRNLSDCAAMACLPAAAVATVALPKDVGVDYAKELFLGIQEAGDVFGCAVVGGDTGAWDGKLVVTVTIMGRSAGVKPVTRSGAEAGDRIFVTGPLGGSILGRHMTFEPRIKLARYLVQHFSIHGMIDLSDGLGRDLRNICTASGGLGAEIDVAKLPIHSDVERLSNTVSAAAHAMGDGEDYELLIASPDDLPQPCTQIGVLTSNGKLALHTEKALVEIDWNEAGGWEHSL